MTKTVWNSNCDLLRKDVLTFFVLFVMLLKLLEVYNFFVAKYAMAEQPFISLFSLCHQENKGRAIALAVL